MNGIPLNAVIWLVGAIFGAGSAWAALQRTRKDLNGVGGRQRRFEKNVVLALMINAQKREDRMLLAQFLKDP